MSGGGKGGSETTTTRVKLDPRLETGAAEAIAAALRTAALPYQPNMGLQVAAFSPEEEAAFRGASEAAAAFGMPSAAQSDVAGYMPAPENVGGFRGYSTEALYNDAMNRSTTPSYQAMRDALRASYVQSADKVSANPNFTAAAAGNNPAVGQYQLTELQRELQKAKDFNAQLQSQQGAQQDDVRKRLAYGPNWRNM